MQNKLKLVFACMAAILVIVAAAVIFKPGKRNTHNTDNITGTGSKNNIVQEKTSIPDITPRDKRLDITELDVKKDGIKNLSELEYYKNLKILSLKDYGLKNISRLKGVKGIVSLNLSGNKNLSDLTGIEGMESLESLNIRETSVSDISAVKSLSSLKSLDISYTLVEDTSPLKECKKLEKLYAGYNNENFTDSSILDIAVSLKNLKELDLTGDVAIAGGMENIKNINSLVSLKLGGTFINNRQCSYIADLKQLEILDLQSNINITDFNFLTGLKNLHELDLSATGITDIKGIEKLKNLRKLDLSLTFVEDISVLGRLKNLEKLVLTGNSSINKQVKALKKSLPGCEIEIQ